MSAAVEALWRLQPTTAGGPICPQVPPGATCCWHPCPGAKLWLLLPPLLHCHVSPCPLPTRCVAVL